MSASRCAGRPVRRTGVGRRIISEREGKRDWEVGILCVLMDWYMWVPRVSFQKDNIKGQKSKGNTYLGLLARLGGGDVGLLALGTGDGHGCLVLGGWWWGWWAVFGCVCGWVSELGCRSGMRGAEPPTKQGQGQAAWMDRHACVCAGWCRVLWAGVCGLGILEGEWMSFRDADPVDLA